MKEQTWQERFSKLFPSGLVDGSNSDLIATDLVKQFISELRKRDMEALIDEFDKTHFVGDTEVDIVRYTSELIKKLIKNYYEK